MNAQTFKALPKLNRNLVAHGQPKTRREKVLYSITKEGRLKLHRDLSKWRCKTVGKNHSVYFSEAQSPAEVQHERELRAVVSKFSKELSLDNEQAIARTNLKLREALDARL